MPTPLDILVDPISLTVLGIYAALMLWEALFPGRELPKVRGWKFRGLAAFVVFFYLSSYLPLFWDQYLAPYQLFDLSGWGVVGGVVVGLLVYEVCAWAWHWSMHRFDSLWRIHQMHHSAERLDTFGAFYFSPWDMIGWTAVGSFALVLVVGVTPQAATVLILLINLMGIFQHANIRTPRWLGYIVQRPESHTVHHGRGVHAKNYADLPLCDILFGTFENPEGYELKTGFYDGASARVADMVLLRDIAARSEEAAPPSSELPLGA